MLSYTEMAVTMEEADEYAGARGIVSWFEAHDPAKALRRGQDYIAGRFNGRWRTDWTVAPEVVKYAIVEAAIREAVAPGSLLPDWKPEGQIKRLKKGVGPLQRETEYVTPISASASLPVFSVIDGLLAGLIKSTSGSINFGVRRG